VVQSIDLVPQESRSGIGAGAIVGAVVGGVLGNQVGKGDGRTAATVLGAAGGAYAGNETQKRSQQPQQPDAVRLQVRLNDGANVTVMQEATGDIRVGERVVVQNGLARRY
jgi:outer membrane lipoprotein SlyB